MSDLFQYCINTLNEAKQATDVKSKILNLEQIKEVIFHRNPDFFPRLLPEVEKFIFETSAELRRYILKFMHDAFVHNSNGIGSYLAVLNCLSDINSNKNTLLIALQLFKQTYESLILCIANFPSSSSNGEKADPKILWEIFRSVFAKLSGQITLVQSNDVRNACLQLMETSILFGLPPPPKIQDPRLARMMRQTGVQSASKTAESIPLNHMIIDRNQLVRDAEDMFMKLILWAGRNGPQENPFDASLMSSVGIILGNIAADRPVKAGDASKAMTSLIQGKNSLCSSMAPKERAEIARSIGKLVKVAKATGETDTTIGTLTMLSKELETLGIVENDSSLGKRTAEKANLDDDDIDFNSIRNSALSALELATQKNKKLKLDHAKDSLDEIAGNQSDISGQIFTHTELSNELFYFSDFLTSFSANLAHIHTSIVSLPSNLNWLPNREASSEQMNLMLCEVSLHSLVRMLENFENIRVYGEKMAAAHIQLIVRLAIKLAQEPSFSNDLVDIPVISHFQSVSQDSISLEDIKSSVQLPKPLWILISFCFHGDIRRKVSSSMSKDYEFANVRMPILMCLIQTLFADKTLGGTSMFSLYSLVCYLVVSRLLQYSSFKPLLIPSILNFPYIPDQLLSLFKALLYTGNRVMMNECLILLCAVVELYFPDDVDPFNSYFYSDIACDGDYSLSEKSSFLSLKYLLWSTVSKDFELRSKSIATILNQLLTKKPSIIGVICGFSIKNMCYVLPRSILESYLKRYDTKSSLSSTLACLVEGVGAKNEDKTCDAMEISNSTNCDSHDKDGHDSPSLNVPRICQLSVDEFQYYSSWTSVSMDDFVDESSSKSIVKRFIHLLIQICVSQYSMLHILLDSFAAAQFGMCDEYSQFSIVLTSVMAIIKEEIELIIPAISKKSKPENIMDMFSRSDPLSWGLLETILYALHKDYHIPPSSLVVEKLKSILEARKLHLKREDNDGKNMILNYHLDDIPYIVPILGGLPSSDVIALMPLILKAFLTQTSKLKEAYHRIVLARPPPLSKNVLLITLLR